MWPKNVLVTAANGDLAEAVSGVLEDAFPSANIFGCESGNLWPAKVIINNVTKVPRGDAKNYIVAIKKIVDQFKIDLVIPCSDPELVRFASAKRNKELDFKILMPSPEIIDIFSDKYLGAEWLREHNIGSPKTTLLSTASVTDLPLIVKPRIGSGSLGVYTVRTPELLEGLKSEYGDSCISQEYLDVDDQEYTCTFFQSNNIVRILILHRRLDAGKTIEAKIIKNIEIELLLMNLIKIIDLNGLLNVQLRLTDKGPKIFEINPRVSSTVKMRHILGFNDLVWAIKNINGEKLPQFKDNLNGTIYRLSREVIKPNNGHGRI